MPVTLTDVAQVAGVSVTTASRVLSKSSHPVSAQTRARVLDVARQLGYQPNLIARSLRTDRTYTVGIVVQDVAEFFTSNIVRGILDLLKSHGYFGMIVCTDYDLDVEVEVVHNLVHRSCDGIIFVDTALHDLDLVLPRSDLPNIYVNRRYKEANDRCVIPDNRNAARLATAHLLRLGHRRIAYIGGPPGWVASAERLAGYREALEAHDVPYDPALTAQGDWQVASGVQAVQRFLQHPILPTALFATSDRMAVGAMYALQEAGLRIPDDIAVVGYDDRPLAAFVRPRLTSVCQPGHAMGQTAARLLLDEIEGRAQNKGIVQVPGELIVRESCGAGFPD